MPQALWCSAACIFQIHDFIKRMISLFLLSVVGLSPFPFYSASVLFLQFFSSLLLKLLLPGSVNGGISVSLSLLLLLSPVFGFSQRLNSGVLT